MMRTAIAILSLAGTALAQGSSPSNDGEVTVTPSAYVTTPVAPMNTATGPDVPSSDLTSTVVIQSTSTYTLPIPITSYVTSGANFSSLAITEASHTETVPVPVGPTAPIMSSSQGGVANGTYTTSAPPAYTGAANSQKPMAALVAGAIAAIAMV